MSVIARASAARWPERSSLAKAFMSMALPVIVPLGRPRPSFAKRRKAAFDEGFQWWQAVLDNIPNYSDVGGVIGMAQPIAEIDHSLPLDFRSVPLDFVSKFSRRFANHFKIPLSRHAAQFVGRKSIEATVEEHFFDLGNGFQNVPQPVLDGWRHLEYLDQIVGNSFNNTRLQQIPHRYLNREPYVVLDQVQDFEIVKSRRIPSGGRFDQDVKIAAGTCVSARTGAKQIQAGHALRLNRRRYLAQLCDDFFDWDVCNVIHGCILSHLPEMRSYSAASLCPKRALSLWISSSAASAITVPGG